MSIDQFDKTGFHSGMKVEYIGQTYHLVSVDFKEKLVGIDMYGAADLKWVRCENVKLIL